MAVRTLVIQVAALGWDLLARRGRRLGGLPFAPLRSVFPAVTCTAQASFRTAAEPSRHGMIANGLYFPDLKRPMFWEQSAALVQGPRIWEASRAAGGTVGMLFWQQSLGESVDLLLSPRPIHKHAGGMIQDCYSQPADLYERLVRAVGRPFNLFRYWGPLAGRKSTDWIVDATDAVMAMSDLAPDLLLTYLPDLDYDLQRFGPDHAKADAALARMDLWLDRLVQSAARNGYQVVVFGDYAMQSVTGPAVYPNRALRDVGLFSVRRIGPRAYPDFFAPRAFAVVDHAVAQVYVPDASLVAKVQELLSGLDGVAECRPRQVDDHERCGELLLVAKPGRWFAYPWWRDPREAPDFATHVDIHNKPGFDPCELFFGWPPGSVSRDPDRVGGTHGLADAGALSAWASTRELALPEEPTLVDLASCLL